MSTDGPVTRRSFLFGAGVALGGLTLAPRQLSRLSPYSRLFSPSRQGSGLSAFRVPFLAEMQVPDPDIFYEGRRPNGVTTSVYEGLISYRPVSAGVTPCTTH